MRSRIHTEAGTKQVRTIYESTITYELATNPLQIPRTNHESAMIAGELGRYKEFTFISLFIHSLLRRKAGGRGEGGLAREPGKREKTESPPSPEYLPLHESAPEVVWQIQQQSQWPLRQWLVMLVILTYWPSHYTITPVSAMYLLYWSGEWFDDCDFLCVAYRHRLLLWLSS